MGDRFGRFSRRDGNRVRSSPRRGLHGLQDDLRRRRAVGSSRPADARIPRFTDDRYAGYLANLAPSLFRERHEPRLPERISGAEYLRLAQEHVDPFTKARPEAMYAIRACTRYAVEENERVRLFAQLARGADPADVRPAAELMGELMYQSHYAYTETGLGNAATDLLVQLAREQGHTRGIFGAKVTGGGTGGTVAVLGLADREDAFACLVDHYAQARGARPYVFRGSSPGADRFGVIELTAARS